jgi:hypothetical protein
VRRITFCVFATLVFGCLAAAQDAPRGEVFGGYSYLNVDYQGGSSYSVPRQSANGWEVAPAFDINSWFAMEGDFAGYYKNNVPFFIGYPNADFHDYSFTGGPRFNYRAPRYTGFVHALVGGDHLHGSISGLGSASQNSFAFLTGGGVEWRLGRTSHWALRGSADYVLTRHNIAKALGFPLPTANQNNFRVSAGIVFLFGRAEWSRPQAQKGSADRQQCAATSEAPQFGIVGCETSGGFRVAFVHPGSPASACGLKPGDIVTSIDGRAVSSSHEIETAIAANSSGTIRVGYLIQGSFLTEHEVKVR